jgi:hypothetical protein
MKQFDLRALKDCKPLADVFDCFEKTDTMPPLPKLQFGREFKIGEHLLQPIALPVTVDQRAACALSLRDALKGRGVPLFMLKSTPVHTDVPALNINLFSASVRRRMVTFAKGSQNLAVVRHAEAVLALGYTPVSINNSDDKGYACFFARDMPQGTLVAVHYGGPVDRANWNPTRVPDPGQGSDLEFCKLAAGVGGVEDSLVVYPDAGGSGLSRFFNHSDDPNLIAILAHLADTGEVVWLVFTARPVVEGEEAAWRYTGSYRDVPSSQLKQ